MSVWRRAVGDGPVSQALSKPIVQHKPTSVTRRGMENNVDKRKAAGIDIDVTLDNDLGLEDDKGGNLNEIDDEQPAVRVYFSVVSELNRLYHFIWLFGVNKGARCRAQDGMQPRVSSSALQRLKIIPEDVRNAT